LSETCSADLEINKLLLLHLVGHLYYLPTTMMHGQTQIKFSVFVSRHHNHGNQEMTHSLIHSVSHTSVF